MGEDPGPATAQEAAAAWIDDVLAHRDLARAWPGTDPQLRLVLAQDWVWNHRHGTDLHEGWDEIAAGLAACPPADVRWPRFASDLLSMWARTWRGFGTDAWTVRTQPEILDLDLEVVTFVETESGLVRRFVLRHDGGHWLVASVDGELLFEPGWPPRQGRPSP